MINVLSLFDGMSCGRIALERAGVEVSTYYASELDKYAIQVSQANYPEIVQLGDVTKWREWDLDWSSIDLLIGGSPCQGFSFAGKQAGTSAILNGEKIIVTDRETYLDLKEKGAEFLSQSYLFWEYVLCLDHVRAHNKNAKFLLENVKMKKELLDMISEAVGCEHIPINSTLVSAQNRLRYYWSNLPIDQPDDKKILLNSILETTPDVIFDSGMQLHEGYSGGNQLNPKYKSQANTIHKDKSATLCAGTHGYANGYVDKKYYLSEKATAYINKPERINKKLTAINGDKSLCLLRNYDNSKNGTFLCVDANGRVDDEKTGTITQRYHKGVENHGSNPFIFESGTSRFRKLTPIECERLQTVPDNYTSSVSNTQRYKMLGNGWTVDVIAHIFSSLNTEA